MAKIYHADVYGTRKSKYNLLRSSDLQSIDWQELTPNTPFYLFRPQEQELREEYEQGWHINDVFPVNVLGFQTHRDQFAIDFDKDALKKRIEDFKNGSASESELRDRYALGLWDFSNSRAHMRADSQWESTITQIQYRPFDTRFCYYNNDVVDRPRKEIVKHILNKPNLIFNMTRQTRADTWQHVLVSSLPTPAVFIEIKDGSSVFPLWLYPAEGSLEADAEREANLSMAFMEALAERVGTTPTPEAVFQYAYAVFHAPTYRTRYAPFLKIDFPRLPLPPDADTFHALAALGAQLVGLHLLESPALTPTRIAYPVGGDHMVEKRNATGRYAPPTLDGKPGRVFLNSTEIFDNVPPEAWAFRVGGYQPAFKWLDDRVGRALTETDITHYRKLLAALRETAALLPLVDAAFVRML